MMSKLLPSSFFRWAAYRGIILAVFLSLGAIQAETVILHLRNGDRIAGTITSEDTNKVTVSTVWTKSLSIPLSAIERREKATTEPMKGVPAAAAVNSQQKTPAVTSPQPGQTNIAAAANPASAVERPTTASSKITTAAPQPGSAVTQSASSAANAAPTAKETAPATTNAAPITAKSAPVTAKPAGTTKPKPPKHWKIDARIGVDMVDGARDRQLYYGRAKLTYQKPYAKNPRQFFRNIFDYSVEYGKTDGVLSANRMNGSSKTDFDLAKHFFVYNLGGAGYDEVRKIDIQYELGPGIGYHLFTRTNFVLDTEIGLNYQVQERADNTDTRNFYLRLAEDFTWKLGKKLTVTEKFEFFPNADDFSQYRARFECTLSYWLLQYLTLNLTVLDLYDTQPARNVSNNELQIRSSLGFVF